MSDLANIEDIYTLSPLQEGILFHTLYASTTTMYTNQMSFIIKGELDIGAFRRSWEDVVESQAVLRTSVVYEHGQKPVQVVYRHLALPFTELDWRSRSPEDQNQCLDNFCQEDFERGFVLSKPPLMRLTFIHLAQEKYQVIWTTHHIILDGWSRSLLIEEVFERYQAYCQGKLPAKRNSHPYRDYIAWLQKNPTQAEDFWRAVLKGKTAPTPLDLDTFHQPEQAQTNQPAIEWREAPPEVWEQLRLLARQHQVTVNTIIQGAWGLLLSHYSEEQDILFGVTLSGRPTTLPGVESMVGLFINTLPLRIQVRPDISLGSWLQEIFALQGRLLQHQQSSLVEVQRWSDIPREYPLFESFLVFNNYPAPTLQVQGWGNIEICDLRFRDHNNYPLCLKVIPDDGLQFSASYDSSRFTSAMVTRLLDHFLVLLTDIAAHPDKRLREYSLLSVSERQKILVDWNASQAALPYERGFQQLFEEQVARTPDAIAFTCADESLTYQQLNTQVNQYAHHLQELKIGPECVVALQARRDIHFWITMLGILKAGGVYLPLNLRDSPKSIAQVLAQSNVGLLLIDEEFLPELEAAYQQLPGEQFPRFLTLDELGHDGRPATNPLPRSLSRNLAYILYTSGSTGLPKGAMVEHCGMLNHLYEKTKDIQLGPGDRLAQNASQSFDVSVWQVLAPLLIGGGVHIVKDEISLHPLRLLEHVEEHAITLLQMVPSMLRGILDEIDSREHKPELRTLRWIIPTGEALPTELCRRWLRLYPHIPLLNTYGSTECSDDQCHYPIAQIKPDEDPLPIMPIGFPIANMRMYVLDSHLQLVPQGLTGELYIAGIGVGRGYYKNPTQTAEVFVPHPFASEPGERLYKTGDKVRWRMDGSLEFLRRVDYPIKLRGVRIEPGEIEAALSRHSLVQEAKVLIREDVPGFQRLVAYMVLQKTGHDLSGVQEPHILFREFLKQELPTWKIPSVFVLLEAFPLNANGKLDYRALPVPVEADVSDAENDDAPRTVVEEIVASYFATVLGKEKVGIHANFFDLGGHSLLATQVIARLCATFRVDIPFPAFFEHSTAAEVAQTLLAYEPVPGQIEKIATALKIIQGMSAEEKQRLLEQSAKKGGHQA